MRRLKTHFEQIPVEEVKKIIEAEVAEKKQTDGDDDVIVETPPSKSEPSGVHSLHKGSLKMAASFGMEYRDDDLQYPDWQSPVQKALLELNRDKLNALVAEAEAVTFNRLQATSQDTDHTAERQAIEDALASLRETNMTAQYRTFEDESAVDLKRAEDALREKEDRYRTLFDLAPVAVYSCDASGVIRDYNNRAAELWGRKPERGDTDERFCGSFKLYRPDGSFMPHEQCPMGDVLTGKIPGTHDAEVHIERPDGSRIIVIVNIAPLKDDRGEITGAINSFYDVTERKRAEEALRESATERARAEEAYVKMKFNCDLQTKSLNP
jgi:PAS domain-containing protein